MPALYTEGQLLYKKSHLDSNLNKTVQFIRYFLFWKSKTVEHKKLQIHFYASLGQSEVSRDFRFENLYPETLTTGL
jgi:hypothetical protein